ncbi:synaptotagmin-5 isoform X3 [Zootermopsis nevadensis]|uniref:synaptotagmin-5 isoform X3 n=1 Tax=Zootermopsis nevadensis TaxID=136037 RepID=UPI000B8EE433|nr:synaptotagmin-5 isoform X3 [Zootermopsis nevadensis]
MSGGGLGPAGCWITHKGLETWARMAKERNTHKTQEFNVAKEQHAVQPVPTVAPHSVNPELMRSPLDSSPILTHQSKSYPGGQPRLARTPSVSSQSSLDSSVSRQQGHRGSSPQIRTFAPDGRTTSSSALHHLHAAQSTDPGSASTNNQSRSPSPGSCHRAASLDMRCSSPGGASSAFCGSTGDLRTPSPSQSSLASLTDRGSASSVCNSPVPPQSPRGAAISRCLSPLLIPPVPSRSLVSDPPAPPASPLGALQPDLYQRQDGPLFLGSRRSGPSLGRLHLRLKYDFDRSDLHVHLIEAHDLAGSDQGGFNDPYVRLSLVPAVDNRKRQTTIHRNDPNPFFDQHFKFPVSHEDLQEKTLVLQVFDYDRFSRNDVVGEVCMSMDEFDVASNVEVWGEITKNKKPPEEMQEVLLSLSYLPSAERLTVVLLKARNLFLPKDKDNIDPFVKVYLLSGGKRVKKKKTAARKGTCNPVWNEALTFNVASSSLSNAAVEVCLIDQGNDLIGNNPLLGSFVIGPEEEGPERDHWCDMTQSPRKAVAMWHTLR